MAEATLPAAASAKLRPHWPALEGTSWDELGGDGFAALGPLTAEAYASDATDDTPASARRLLCDALYLTRHFSGRGETIDPRTGRRRPWINAAAIALRLAPWSDVASWVPSMVECAQCAVQ